jgi:hypothetical protein
MKLILASFVLISSLAIAQSSSGSQSGASSGSSSGSSVTCHLNNGSTVCKDQNGNVIPVENSSGSQSGAGNGTTAGSLSGRDRNESDVNCYRNGESIICKGQGGSTIPVTQNISNEKQPCFKQCRDGLEKHGCKSCLKKHPETYQLDESVFGPVSQPCYKECKQGTKKPSCLKCLQANPDVYTLDEKVFGNKAQPCYSQCREGLEKNGCALCIVKNQKTFKLGTVNEEFSDCQRSDDLQSITCPEGRYVKDGSVVDSIRGSNIKETSPVKATIQLKGNSASEQ